MWRGRGETRTRSHLSRAVSRRSCKGWPGRSTQSVHRPRECHPVEIPGVATGEEGDDSSDLSRLARPAMGTPSTKRLCNEVPSASAARRNWLLRVTPGWDGIDSDLPAVVQRHHVGEVRCALGYVLNGLAPITAERAHGSDDPVGLWRHRVDKPRRHSGDDVAGPRHRGGHMHHAGPSRRTRPSPARPCPRSAGPRRRRGRPRRPTHLARIRQLPQPLTSLQIIPNDRWRLSAAGQGFRQRADSRPGLGLLGDTGVPTSHTQPGARHAPADPRACPYKHYPIFGQKFDRMARQYYVNLGQTLDGS